MSAIKHMLGLKFGRLTPVEYVGVRCRKAVWRCLCDCGKYVEVPGVYLRGGNTKSCGCYRVEQMSEVGRQNYNHGMTDHPALHAYCNAKDRCLNESSQGYADYGGRGIEFRFTSFEQFWEELGPTWSPDLSIDRKDNEGHYEPGNCRWATREEQQNNRRCNFTVTFADREDTLANWCRELNLNYETVRARLNRGVSVSEAFTARCSPFRGT